MSQIVAAYTPSVAIRVSPSRFREDCPIRNYFNSRGKMEVFPDCARDASSRLSLKPTSSKLIELANGCPNKRSKMAPRSQGGGTLNRKLGQQSSQVLVSGIRSLLESRHIRTDPIDRVSNNANDVLWICIDPLSSEFPGDHPNHQLIETLNDIACDVRLRV